jgi:hypothetical protein
MLVNALHARGGVLAEKARAQARRSDLAVHVRRTLDSREERPVDEALRHSKAASVQLNGLRAAGEAAGLSRKELGAKGGYAP